MNFIYISGGKSSTRRECWNKPHYISRCQVGTAHSRCGKDGVIAGGGWVGLVEGVPSRDKELIDYHFIPIHYLVLIIFQYLVMILLSIITSF